MSLVTAKEMLQAAGEDLQETSCEEAETVITYYFVLFFSLLPAPSLSITDRASVPSQTRMRS